MATVELAIGCKGTYVLNANYFTAHDATTGDEVTSGTTVGQLKKANNDYVVYRTFLVINTSGLDDSCLIESATLKLDEQSDKSYRDFEIIIKNGQPTYPHNPIEEGDYELAHYSGNGGSKNTSEATGAWDPFHISLNATGLSWINKTGYTKLALISSLDALSDAPTDYEYFLFSNVMYIDIEYYIPTGIPVVGDPTYATKATYAVATANISDASGGYEERGFEYGISEASTWAVRETGVWGATGNYSLSITGLLPLTTYYARAYVTNDYGTGYSGWTSFTTTDVPSYGIYEETNTATLCFYVRKFGGKWSIKHGPYTTDQADIAITKILEAQGKGKFQIKFESDVLTGISAGVMVKCDVKART